MEKDIPGFVGYTIDKLGTVRKIVPQGIVSPKIGRRSKEYRVSLKNDQWKIVRPKVSRLVMITFSPLEGIDYDWVSVCYKDGDLTNYALGNLEWDIEGYSPPFDATLLENKDRFAVIPGFSNYEVSPFGVIRNVRTLSELTPGLSSVGYLCVRITDDSGKSTYVGVHHLMARALLKHPTDVDQLVTNHLNGVKTDNHPTNLEWATYSRNITHAHYSGLREEIVAVYAVNSSTGQKLMFLSIGDTARFFDNCNPGKIHWWLNNNAGKVEREGWFVSTDKKDLEHCPSQQ